MSGSRLPALFIAAMIMCGALFIFAGEQQSSSSDDITEDQALGAIPAGAIPVSNATEFGRIAGGGTYGGVTWSLSAYYYLTNDITLSGTYATKATSSSSPFNGTLDGRGYTVKGLSASANASLFMYASNATIKDLHIYGNIGGITSTVSIAAGLVAQVVNNGTLKIIRCNVEINFTVTGTSISQKIGGMVGVLNSSAGAAVQISDSTFTGNITIPATGSLGYYGGFLGQISVNSINSFINNCLFSGSFNFNGNSNGPSRCSAIVGQGTTEISIINCYALDTVNFSNSPMNSIDGISNPIRGLNQASGSKTSSDLKPTLSDAQNNNSVYFAGTTDHTGHMGQQNTFYGWNFNTVWTIDPLVNNGYPSLLPPGPDVPAIRNISAVIDGLTVNYSATVNGATLLTLDFSDGSSPVQASPPNLNDYVIAQSHTYSAPGTYTIGLSAAGPGGITVENTSVTVDYKYFTVTFITYGSNSFTSSVRDGLTVAQPADPERDGHDFTGWFTDATLATQFNFSTSITQNTTIYAGWDEIIIWHTVTFIIDTETSFSEWVQEGSKIIRPQDPVLEGYEFLGWFYNSLLEAEFDFDTPIYYDLDLFAGWSYIPVFWQVTFIIDTETSFSELVEDGQLVDQPQDPVLEGCEFLGWFADPELQDLFDFLDPIFDDVFVFAAWEEIDDLVDPGDGGEDGPGNGSGVDLVQLIMVIASIVMIIAGLIVAIETDHKILGVLVIVVGALIMVQIFLYDLAEIIKTYLESLR